VFLAILFRKASFVKNITFDHYANFVIILSLDRYGRKTRINQCRLRIVFQSKNKKAKSKNAVSRRDKFLLGSLTEDMRGSSSFALRGFGGQVATLRAGVNLKAKARGGEKR
jgi:hypothetical protein